MPRLTDYGALKARTERGQERLRQRLCKVETRGQLDQERPQLWAQALHLRQEALKGGGHLDEAPRVSDLLGHFDRELERVGDRSRPPRIRGRAMRTVEGRVHFHPREALGIPLEVRALSGEGMGVLGR